MNLDQPRILRLLGRCLTYCDLHEVAASSQRVYRQNIADWLHWRATQQHPDDIRKVTVEELREHWKPCSWCRMSSCCWSGWPWTPRSRAARGP